MAPFQTWEGGVVRIDAPPIIPESYVKISFRWICRSEVNTQSSGGLSLSITETSFPI